MRAMIRLSCDNDHLKVRGNSLVEELFVNLIDNSLKYGYTNGGEVLVSVLSRKEGVEVYVMDEGPGIPKEYRDDVFLRFKRLENERGRGSGIGLMICKRIAESLGGDISAVNRPDGLKGACFKVEFPGI